MILETFAILMCRQALSLVMLTAPIAMEHKICTDTSRQSYQKMNEEEFKRKLKLMVRSNEGFRNYVYEDKRGYLTMGTGQRRTKDELKKYKEGDIVNEAYLERLFQKDFESHYKAAKGIVGFDSLSVSQKAALIDLTFNMGPYWMKKFPNMMKEIKEFSEAETEVLKLIHTRKIGSELKYKNFAKGDFSSSKYFTQVPNRAYKNFKRLLNQDPEWDLEEVSFQQELGEENAQTNLAF